MTAARQVRFTREDYARLERTSNVRHEYLDGIVYAMAGGTPEHAGLAMSVGALLSNHLRDRPCRVFSSDLRVRILATGLETYPDVSVVCGKLERHPEEDLAITNPTIIVEVLSPSTDAYDRGEKLRHYKQIPSLREVVLVDHREKLIEVHHRDDDGTWQRHQATPGGAVKLASINGELAVDEVYRDNLEPERA